MFPVHGAGIGISVSKTVVIIEILLLVQSRDTGLYEIPLLLCEKQQKAGILADGGDPGLLKTGEGRFQSLITQSRGKEAVFRFMQKAAPWAILAGQPGKDGQSAFLEGRGFADFLHSFFADRRAGRLL